MCATSSTQWRRPRKTWSKADKSSSRYSGSWIRRDFVDEGGRLAAALAPIGNRRKRIQFIGVAEHWKEEFNAALQHQLASRVRRKSARKRPRYQARELVSAPKELQARQDCQVDSLNP